MPDLDFAVECAEPVPYAAGPLLALKLRIVNARSDERIVSIMLHCQLRIEAPRRRYSQAEQARLRDLFGEPERWGQTLTHTLWTHTGVNIGPFQGEARADLQVPCTFDFNVASTKYFHALESGEIPLCLLFSGTVFYQLPDGQLQVAQIPWNKEARYRLPVMVWKGVMDLYYPNTAWLSLRRDIFDRLLDYKIQHGVPTWEDALERLLAASNEGVPA